MAVQKGIHDAKYHYANYGIRLGEVTMDVSKILEAKAAMVKG